MEMMQFFDRNFFKVTFQFMVMISLGIAVITFISGLNHGQDATAGVVRGE